MIGHYREEFIYRFFSHIIVYNLNCWQKVYEEKKNPFSNRIGP